jgi:acid phosphatase type 7
MRSVMLKVGVALGALGLAVPTALAASAATPEERADAPSAARVRDVPVVAVAGDIATDESTDRTTAGVVRSINPDYVLTVGDHTYPYGSRQYFYAYYDGTWGDFKGRTRPAPGNHEYVSGAGSPPYYYTYFARQIPDRNRGRFYAFNVGRWRLYSLNCEIACGSGSDQARWLRNDLANWPGRHKLAYLHRPRYSCGAHGSDTLPDALWERLIAARTDLVLAGHDHNYQRFPRMNSNGEYASRGPVSFVVGAGGAHLYSIDGNEGQQGCSKAQYVQSRKHGVLRLRLGAYRFGWRFIAGDRTVMDSGFRRTLRR